MTFCVIFGTVYKFLCNRGRTLFPETSRLILDRSVELVCSTSAQPIYRQKSADNKIVRTQYPFLPTSKPSQGNSKVETDTFDQELDTGRDIERGLKVLPDHMFLMTLMRKRCDLNWFRLVK